MVMIVFLQLPDVVRINRLTRSDGFLGRAEIPRRKPAVAFVFIARIDRSGLAAVFMGLIAYRHVAGVSVEILAHQRYLFRHAGHFHGPLLADPSGDHRPALGALRASSSRLKVILRASGGPTLLTSSEEETAA